MATTYTTNYHLGKQTDHADKFDMDVITDNMDILDEALGAVASEIEDARGTYSTLDDRMDAQDAAIAVNRAELAELVDSGAKNVLDLNKATNVIVGSGISYTFTDGILTVTWSGIPAEGRTLKFKNIPHIEGSYILSGAQILTDATEIRADIRQGATASDIIVQDYGQTDREPFTFQSGVFDYVIRIATESGTATYKPMICSVPAWTVSKAYQPYRPSYQELYERVVALEQAQQ